MQGNQSAGSIWQQLSDPVFELACFMSRSQKWDNSDMYVCRKVIESLTRKEVPEG